VLSTLEEQISGADEFNLAPPELDRDALRNDLERVTRLELRE
jgi:hypothetical protein